MFEEGDRVVVANHVRVFHGIVGVVLIKWPTGAWQYDVEIQGGDHDGQIFPFGESELLPLKED